MPEGHVGPREDPESAAQGVPADGEGTTETPAESDAGATGASEGPASSAENSSTSKGASPDAEIHEISSGSGDLFVDAPSQRVEGKEESDDDDASSGHCEPCSKVIHDRNVGAREEAEAGAKAGQDRLAEAQKIVEPRAPPVRQMPKRKWVDTAA